MCGIVGLIGTQYAAQESFLALTTLQHRGQDAAGILTFDELGFHLVKNIGLVDSVFNRENMQVLTGSQSLAHARYSTVGRGDLGDVQPLLLSYPFGIGMIHNGNIANAETLARELRTKARRQLLTSSDTEVVLNLFADSLDRSYRKGAVGVDESADANVTHEAFFEHLCTAVSELHQRLNGSYSIVSLIAGQGLVAFRDPLGIRPLAWGKRDGNLPSGEAHLFASETVALPFLGYHFERDVAPGEVVFIDLQGKVHTRVLGKESRTRHCMFEWVYFSSPESEIDGVPVYGARIELGRQLARQIKSLSKKGEVEADLVVPVPDTARIAAIAIAEELGIPYREVLIKNRYIKRTFILDSNEKRKAAVSLKLSPVRSELEGKRVLLVDDSIVRGTTSRKIIELVRQAGAKSVSFVSTCPPIQHPCFYGIDFPSRDELIGSGRTNEEIRTELGADQVVYQDTDGLKKAIQAASRTSKCGDLCTACLDGKYPTDVGSFERFAEKRRSDRKKAE